MSRSLRAASVLAGLCFSTWAFAAGKSLDAVPLGGEKVRLDGLFKEWKGRMTTLSVKQSGAASPAEGMIGYDDKFVYVAFDASDKAIARTAAAGNGEDHVTLLIAFPTSSGSWASHAVDLFPGEPGKVGGAVKKNGSAVAGAQLVEAPAKVGYTFEAKIPWSAFPQSRTTRVGLRAALRFTDASAPGRIAGVSATGSGSGGSLPLLPLEAEQGLEASLLKPKRLGNKPRYAALGNVSGDGLLEHVAVYGSYLTIVGPGYKGGKQFFFGDTGASNVSRLELIDFDGDGRDDILLEKRVSGGEKDKFRELVEVMKVGGNETPFPIFSHEISIITKDGRIENNAKVIKRGKLPAIEIAQDKAEGFEPESYKEPRIGEMASALLPWENVQSRVFQWDGSAMAKLDEKTGAPKVKPAGAGKSDGPPPPPAPRPPTADELQDRLYALYRKDRKVGNRKPSFDFVTDVSGDTAMERVLVHDRDIVVFGPRYRGGTSFAFITVGVADAKDIADVTARDLTGDGKAEIIVRGVLHAKASKELGGDVVDRHALFVYKATEGEGVKRVFAAELGRALGENRILGAIAFLPAERGLSIELRPGRAVGWTEKTYPFPPDTTAAGGLEPLLLPWAGASPRKYGWNGSAYAP